MLVVKRINRVLHMSRQIAHIIQSRSQCTLAILDLTRIINNSTTSLLTKIREQVRRPWGLLIPRVYKVKFYCS